LLQSWFDEAARAEPLLRLVHLERAAKLARDFGFSDLEKRAASAMQSIKPAQLGLVHLSGTTQVPQVDMERHFAQFTDAPTWQVALRRLASGVPPTGNLDENQTLARRLAEKAPLASLFPVVELGGDGLPRFTAATEEEMADYQLRQVEKIGLQLRAPDAAEVLRRIHEKWGPISEKDLATFLGERSHVHDAVAISLANAFRHFFRSEFEAAAYIAVPRIEALVRGIVLSLGQGIYRVQREKSPGQYPGLGALLPVLRENGLDVSWLRFLSTFLADPAGLNYRNELSHGFLGTVGSADAALVLVARCT